jgi:hypothetical protein
MDPGQVERGWQLAWFIGGGRDVTTDSGWDVTTDGGCAAPEQRQRSPAVASPGVRQADGDLGQSLPQVALSAWRRFPYCLEHLVRVEWPTLVN